MELSWEVFILEDLLLVHLAQELAHLLRDIEDILDSFQNFSVIDEALFNDLLEILIMHLANFFKI